MTLLVFLVWLTFFDRNNFINKIQLKNKITTLQKEKAYYQHKIEEDTPLSRNALFIGKTTLKNLPESNIS